MCEFGGEGAIITTGEVLRIQLPKNGLLVLSEMTPQLWDIHAGLCV